MRHDLVSISFCLFMALSWCLDTFQICKILITTAYDDGGNDNVNNNNGAHLTMDSNELADNKNNITAECLSFDILLTTHNAMQNDTHTLGHPLIYTHAHTHSAY